jgi:glycosyltransferase involved in cell wall biosynthesis
MGLSPGGVWLDARGTQSAAHGERGIARYIAEQTAALIERSPEVVGAIVLDPELPAPTSLERFTGSGLIEAPSRTQPTDRPLPLIYHVMSPFERGIELDDAWPQWVRESECRLVVTLYDLIPLVLRDQYLTDSYWGPWATIWTARLGLIRSADHLLTISKRTADDAAERLGVGRDRITVVDSGVSDKLSSQIGSGAEADSVVKGISRRIRKGFLLYVGGDDPRKNLEGTIQAYSLLSDSVRRAHQLVIVCRLPLLRRAQLVVYARRLGIRVRDLVLTGFVPDRQLAALYRSCGLFVFPSLYEGAGLPVLEAMSCGAPVAASSTSSIPEILGDLEATFDPADPADIARSLSEVLESPDRIGSLRERSRERVRLFTWERVAERTLEGYKRALDADYTPAAR